MTVIDVTILDIRRRVAAGVEWLDANDPGWWKADQPGCGSEGGPIDLDALVMSHACYCVLGQRLGSMWNAPLTVDQAVELGFDTAVGAEMDVDRYNDSAEYAGRARRARDDEFDALTAEWRRCIEARRSAAEVPA